MIEKIYSFLGLARKANKLISGDEVCERALKAGKVDLLIVAEDASLNTRKKFMDACNYNNIKFKIFGKKGLLGKSIGKELRSVIAIQEKEFSRNIIQMIDRANTGYGGEFIGEKESISVGKGT
ncbi:MAG: 50S ribosomal protein L7ae [Clostridium sp.]|nr:50S ribosomal protein L7ae [Clostridium sp.]